MMTAPERIRRVAISGVFDLQNYGDLLFPLIARHELGRHGVDVVPVSPGGGATGWCDTDRCLPMGELFNPDQQLDGVLIGGGNIVYGGVPAHALLSKAPEGSAEDAAAWGPASIWLGPVLAAALRDVPVIWNAPGVPHPLATPWRACLHAAFAASDHIALRDAASRDTAGADGDTRIQVVPDTAAAITRMWPRESLSHDFAALLKRKAYAGAQRFWAIHLRDRSLGQVPLDSIAQWIDGMARTRGLTPLLVAIGPGLGDAEMMRELADRLVADAVVLDDPAGPREIAAAIAYADLWTGASLHGYITAAAYGVPGLLVARPAHRKHGSFLAHVGRPGDLCRSWDDAVATLPATASGRGESRVPGAVLDSLDAHWAAVHSALDDPSGRRNQRAAFLRHYVGHGLRGAAGPRWLLGPFLQRDAGERD